MSSSASVRARERRLLKEMRGLVEFGAECGIVVDGTNMSRWNIILDGPEDTVFAQGKYWAVISFSPEYPAKPPSIEFLTPNGRFATGTPLCLKGATAHHAEDWQPAITIVALISSLRASMGDVTHGLGSVKATDAERRQMARDSAAWNKARPDYAERFGDSEEPPAEALKAPVTSCGEEVASPSVGHDSLSPGPNGSQASTADASTPSMPPPARDEAEKEGGEVRGKGSQVVLLLETILGADILEMWFGHDMAPPPPSALAKIAAALATRDLASYPEIAAAFGEQQLETDGVGPLQGSAFQLVANDGWLPVAKTFNAEKGKGNLCPSVHKMTEAVMVGLLRLRLLAALERGEKVSRASLTQYGVRQ